MILDDLITTLDDYSYDVFNYGVFGYALPLISNNFISLVMSNRLSNSITLNLSFEVKKGMYFEKGDSQYPEVIYYKSDYIFSIYIAVKGSFIKFHENSSCLINSNDLRKEDLIKLLDRVKSLSLLLKQIELVKDELVYDLNNSLVIGDLHFKEVFDSKKNYLIEDNIYIEVLSAYGTAKLDNVDNSEYFDINLLVGIEIVNGDISIILKDLDNHERIDITDWDKGMFENYLECYRNRLLGAPFEIKKF